MVAIGNQNWWERYSSQPAGRWYQPLLTGPLVSQGVGRGKRPEYAHLSSSPNRSKCYMKIYFKKNKAKALTSVQIDQQQNSLIPYILSLFFYRYHTALPSKCNTIRKNITTATPAPAFPPNTLTTLYQNILKKIINFRYVCGRN